MSNLANESENNSDLRVRLAELRVRLSALRLLLLAQRAEAMAFVALLADLMTPEQLAHALELWELRSADFRWPLPSPPSSSRPPHPSRPTPA